MDINQPLKARFIRHEGTDAYFRIYWEVPGKPCHEPWSYHNAMTYLGSSDILVDNKLGGEAWDYAESDPRWPTHCEHCGEPVPAPDAGLKLNYQIFRTSRFNTASRKPESGDMYYVHHDGDCYYWDNCDGNHLEVILPNGWTWDVQSRASNCTRREDKTHRCWVMHGDPETGIVHVDKSGDTCAAGAGSIIAPKYGNNPAWHGFLDQGWLCTQRGRHG